MSQFEAVLRLFPQLPATKNEVKPAPDISLLRRIADLEAETEGIRRRLKQFDFDLQDAIDGFYRRRQSDRMREVRDEERIKRPHQRTWSEIQKSAIDKLIDGGSKQQDETQSEE